MSSVDHLHEETTILPIKENFKMLDGQYALKWNDIAHLNQILIWEVNQTHQGTSGNVR